MQVAINVPPNPSELDDEVRTQAAHWCMRLHDDTCAAEERLNFQRWIQSDPHHAFEYAKMLEIWELSDELPNNQSTSKNCRPRLRVTASAKCNREWKHLSLLADVARTYPGSVLGGRHNALPGGFRFVRPSAVRIEAQCVRPTPCHRAAQESGLQCGSSQGDGTPR